MVAKQWKFINGFEWAVMDPVVEKPGELWMCLTLAYGTLDVKPEEMGALHVLMESIRTELQRPVEYAPGKFDVAQVECLTYFSEIDIRVHGPREIVRQAWLRLPACFDHPELLLPVSGRAAATSMWTADVANRTGINEALLSVFRSDTATFEADRYFASACDLARRISPFEGRYPCVLVTTEPDFLGLGFDREPDSLDLDDLLAVDEGTPRDQYIRGSQWQCGLNYLFSFAVPLTRAGLVARWAIAMDATSILRSLDPKYSEFKVTTEAYSIAPDLIAMIRFDGLDSFEDARRFLDAYFDPDRDFTVNLQQVINRHKDDENLEVSQHLHRINDDSIPTRDEVLALINKVAARAHIAADVASPELLERFPLLTAPKSTYDRFATTHCVPDPVEALPFPSTEGSDLLSSVPASLSGYALALPHHLMVSPERVVAQWHDASQEHNISQVVRRIEIRVSDVACLLRSGKATVLIDSDGSFLPIYPEAYISPESVVLLESLIRELSSRVPVVTIEPLFDEEITLVDRFTREGPSALQEGTIQSLPDYLSHLDFAPASHARAMREQASSTRRVRSASAEADTASLGDNHAQWKTRSRARRTAPANNTLSEPSYGYSGSAQQKIRRYRWLFWLIFVLVFSLARACAHATPKQTHVPKVTPLPTISVTVPTFSISPFTLPTPTQTGQ